VTNKEHVDYVTTTTKTTKRWRWTTTTMMITTWGLETRRVPGICEFFLSLFLFTILTYLRDRQTT
jgi:hypothetical protein